MGRYRIHRLDDGRLTILYRQGPGAPPFECGTSPAATPVNLLQEWVVHHAAPGDVIELAGRLYVKLKAGMA